MFVGIDKPKGMTSHDVVDEIRRITGIRKVGHAGTLDPNATGVLVIAISREATKQIAAIVKKEKEYQALIEFGKVSDTDDGDGVISVVEVEKPPNTSEIQVAIQALVGEIMQVPPQYSAIKVQGEVAHKQARSGKKVKLKARKVQVQEIELLSYQWPFLNLNIRTGPGVYIRSIARDLGEALETGGLLLELQRTRVGKYTLEACMSLTDFEKMYSSLDRK